MPSGGGLKGRGRNYLWLVDHVGHQGDDCLIWPFGLDAYGYGQFGHNGKVLKAHRWMCEAKNGPPPPDKPFAAHNCGKGHLGCVHPGHLEWKTRAENGLDNIRHGVSRRYQRKGRSPRKLSVEQVKEILALKGKMTCKEIALLYGIHRRHISFIHNGGCWPKELKAA
jgi:hypothetical protein